jgi:hypothetical protein
MPASNRPNTIKPIIEILSRILDRYTEVSSTRDFREAHLRLFVSTVRFQLKMIYGGNAPQLSYFPEEVGVEGSLREEFERRRAQVERMIEILEKMPAESATPLMGKRIFIGQEHSDGLMHARMKVVHEVGLFQGHLGIRRAIVLLEECCSEFSNISGLSETGFLEPISRRVLRKSAVS